MMRALTSLALLVACAPSPSDLPSRDASSEVFDAPIIRDVRIARDEAVTDARIDRLTAPDVRVDAAIDRPDAAVDRPDAAIDRPDAAVDRPDAASSDHPDVVVPLADAVDDRAVSTCPEGMVQFPGFCMDRYEAPNERGARPLAMQTAQDGERWCAAIGRRLCTEAEWVRACQGTTARPYPYGATYVRGRCADDRAWISPSWATLGSWPSPAAMAEASRLYQADRSGSRERCVSEEGVVDLAGNVAEWVTRSFTHATNHDHVMKGCYWAGCYGGAAPGCSFVNPAHPGGFRTYEAGFRCCRTQ